MKTRNWRDSIKLTCNTYKSLPNSKGVGRETRPLRSGIQHIFNENAVAGCWVVDQDVGNRADEFAILNDRAAAHVCVKCRTKFFTIFFANLIDFIRNIASFSPRLI